MRKKIDGLIKDLRVPDAKKAGSTSSFPSGPPPQYSSCLKLFNFGVRMGSGAFSLVWPTAKTYPKKSLIYTSFSTRSISKVTQPYASHSIPSTNSSTQLLIPVLAHLDLT